MALNMIDKSNAEIIIPFKDKTLFPNGEYGIKLMGPAIIATRARRIIDKLIVAIITEKIGSSFRGRLMTQSKTQPNTNEKIMLPANAKKNTPIVGSPDCAKKVVTK